MTYSPDWATTFYRTDGYIWHNTFPHVTTQTEYGDPINPTYLDGVGQNNGWYAYPNGTALFAVSDCTAHAVALLSQIQEYKRHGKKRRFSYLWIHGNRDTEYEGSTVHIALDSISSVDGGDGIPEYDLAHPLLSSYSQLPYLATTEPTEYGTAKQAVIDHRSALLANANKYKIQGWDYYAPAQTTIANTKSVIQTEGSALIQIDCSANFNNPPTTGIIVDDPNQPVTGSHLLNIIGWTVKNGIDHWIVQNTWGFWGDIEGAYAPPYVCNAGRCYIPFDYPRINLYVYAYINRYTSTFVWDNPKVQGNEFNLTAEEWNKFTDMLATYRLINGLSIQEFTIAETGMDFTADIFNEAIDGFTGLTYTGTLPSKVAKDDDINASYLNDIVSCLNTVDY